MASKQNKPPKSLIQSGVPDHLQRPDISTIIPATTSSPAKAIPPADEGVIRQMIGSAQDAETAGAADENKTPTSNGALGAYRDLIAPSGFHVP